VGARLHAPPGDRQGFVDLLSGVAGCARVRAALDGEESV
jgi:hypothetical protein